MTWVLPSWIPCPLPCATLPTCPVLLYIIPTLPDCRCLLVWCHTVQTAPARCCLPCVCPDHLPLACPSSLLPSLPRSYSFPLLLCVPVWFCMYSMPIFPYLISPPFSSFPTYPYSVSHNAYLLPLPLPFPPVPSIIDYGTFFFAPITNIFHIILFKMCLVGWHACGLFALPFPLTGLFLYIIFPQPHSLFTCLLLPCLPTLPHMPLYFTTPTYPSFSACHRDNPTLYACVVWVLLPAVCCLAVSPSHLPFIPHIYMHLLFLFTQVCCCFVCPWPAGQHLVIGTCQSLAPTCLIFCLLLCCNISYTFCVCVTTIAYITMGPSPCPLPDLVPPHCPFPTSHFSHMLYHLPSVCPALCVQHILLCLQLQHLLQQAPPAPVPVIFTNTMDTACNNLLPLYAPMPYAVLGLYLYAAFSGSPPRARVPFSSTIPYCVVDCVPTLIAFLFIFAYLRITTNPFQFSASVPVRCAYL